MNLFCVDLTMEITLKKYNFRAIILILLSIQFSHWSFSQNSSAELSISTYGTSALKSHKFSYSLFRGDTLVSITPITNNTSFTKSHIVPNGKYNIQVFKNDSIYHTFSDISLDNGYKIYYRINLDAKTSSEIIENGEKLPDVYNPVLNSYVETDFGYIEFDYGQGFVEASDYPVKHYFRLAGGGSFLKPASRHFGLGHTMIYDLAWTKPKNDTFLVTTPNRGTEKYFRFGLEYKLFFHLTTFNQKAPSKNGVYLDLGAAYNLPILFRHSVIYANHKDIIRKIHRYNDLSAFVRIGIGKVGAILNYRIFDYVNGPYPQNPKISLGLFFLINTY